MREWLGGWTDAVGYHHERWDGKGYPRGLSGEEIPLAGRIVAVADVFDVITSARSYKEAGSANAGRAEIARCAGTQFDPRVVRAFLNVSLGRMRLVMGPLSWLAHTPVLGRLPLTSAAGTVWSTLAVVAAATGLAGAVEEERPREPARATLATTRCMRRSDFGSGGRAARHRRSASARRTDAPERAGGGRAGGRSVAGPGAGRGRPAGHRRPVRDRRGRGRGPPRPRTARRESPTRTRGLITDNPITGPVVPPIDVMTVNDPPIFTAGADQTVVRGRRPHERGGLGDRHLAGASRTRAASRSPSAPATTAPRCSRRSPRSSRTAP